jgi:hypothetical protein
MIACTGAIEEGVNVTGMTAGSSGGGLRSQPWGGEPRHLKVPPGGESATVTITFWPVMVTART